MQPQKENVCTTIKEVRTVTKSTMKFVKGMGAGMAAGMIAGAVGSSLVRINKKGLKKKASKAMKAVGDVVENVQYMMK